MILSGAYGDRASKPWSGGIGRCAEKVLTYYQRIGTRKLTHSGRVNLAERPGAQAAALSGVLIQGAMKKSAELKRKRGFWGML